MRSHFAATLRRLFLPDGLPSPAATPLPVDQSSQTPSPSTPEKRIQAGQEDDRGKAVSREGATPLNSALMDDGENDGWPAGDLDIHYPSQEMASTNPEIGTPGLISRDEDFTMLGPMQRAEPGHGNLARCRHQPVVGIDEMGELEEVYDGIIQDSTSMILDVVQMTEVDEQSQARRDLVSSPSPSPDPQSLTTPRTRQGKRKPTPPTPEPEPTKRQRTSKSDTMQLQLLAKTTRTIKDIATLDNIIFVWERLALLRAAGDSQEGFVKDQSQHEPPQQYLCRRQHLERLWMCIGVNQKTERWAKSLKRICEGTLVGLYNDERERFDERKRQRNLFPAIYGDGEESGLSLPDPIEEYVDLCFPETVMRPGEAASSDAFETRRRGKRRFENMVQRKKPWVMINRRYGKGVFPLLSKSLQEDQ